MNNRDGWVRVCGDDLSEFHRELIATIPKYASIAVSELVLPARPDVLAYEEREVLRKARSGASLKQVKGTAQGGEWDTVVNSRGEVIGRVKRMNSVEYEEQPVTATFGHNAYEGSKPINSDALVEGGIIDGEAFAAKLSQTESFQAFLAKRAASKPGVHRQPPQKAVPHNIEFPLVAGKAGEFKYIQVQPGCLFRGEDLIARDTLDGHGTDIVAMFVGNRLQWPQGAVHPTHTLAPSQLSNGSLFDTCEPALSITLQVRFLKDCEFSATLKGRAVMCG